MKSENMSVDMPTNLSKIYKRAKERSLIEQDDRVREALFALIDAFEQDVYEWRQGKSALSVENPLGLISDSKHSESENLPNSRPFN